MKIKQWVLAAALMISGLGVLASCEKFEEANHDVLCQWINIVDEEGIDWMTGLAYDQYVEVMEFFENGTGYYECYVLKDGELERASYVRGENGNFRYKVNEGIDLRSVAQKNPHVRLDITMSLLTEYYVWTVRYEDGLITDGVNFFTPTTAAQQAQIRQWYESRNAAGLSEKIIGKWILAETNGSPTPTNNKYVITFTSPTKAYLSASLNAYAEVSSLWGNRQEVDVAISGNMVKNTMVLNEHLTVVDDMKVTSITDSDTWGDLKISWIADGTVIKTVEQSIRTVKLTADYSADIVGTWEGRCTSEGSVFDDGQEHRWEYKADGTYVYYMKDGDQWVPSQDPLNEYFVDGNLLCTRWKNAGQETENREWWEIAIDSDIMNWTALRQNPDGTTFTATFSMTKVE